MQNQIDDVQTRVKLEESSAGPESRTSAWRDACVYLLLPLGVSLALVFGYFSGVAWLQSLVSPAVNREFGVLENLQHLLLLGCVVLAARLAWRGTRVLWPVFFGLIAFAALFAFIEELDYGLHYYEALTGVPEAERAEVRNLHNIRRGSGDEWADTIKKSVDAAMISFFVILPWLASRLRLGKLRALVPHKAFVLPMIQALCISSLVHYLDDSGWPHNDSLGRAMGEFRELIVYYIGFIYLFDLWTARKQLDIATGA